MKINHTATFADGSTITRTSESFRYVTAYRIIENATGEEYGTRSGFSTKEILPPSAAAIFRVSRGGRSGAERKRELARREALYTFELAVSVEAEEV
tara:strand:- start:296 stop:583 length:288 start_codon:yes stop_codon:yes gene_type:complete